MHDPTEDLFLAKYHVETDMAIMICVKEGGRGGFSDKGEKKRRGGWVGGEAIAVVPEVNLVAQSHLHAPSSFSLFQS